MKPRRGATIACASGLGVAAVLGAGVAFRKEIVAAWHLHRLRTDGNYLAHVIEEPEGSAGDLAVRRWTKTPEGKEAVFDLLMSEAFETNTGRAVPDVFGSNRGAVWVMAVTDIRGINLEEDGSCRGVKAGPTSASRFRGVERRLPDLMGRVFRWAPDSRLRFRVLKASDAFHTLWMTAGWAEACAQMIHGESPGSDQPVLLFERLAVP